MAKTFSAQVESFVARTQEAVEAVFKQSAQEVIEKMQEVGPSVARGGGGAGNMPVDTGFLRASLVASLNSSSAGISINPSDTATYEYDDGEVNMIIVAAKLGDSIFAVYTAAYARRMEYGFTGTDSLGRSYDQTGYGFVRLAAQQWDTIVNSVVREARSKYKL